MLTLLGVLIVLFFIYVLITRRNDKPSRDSPTMAHSALRELVGRAVEEAKKLPGLSDSTADNSRTHEESNISEQSYEDLLATAILNKVIEKFQKGQVDGNSNVLHEKPSAKAESETELGLDEGVEEGSSSLEPLSQDECSSDCSVPRARRSRNRQEPLSLTIEERIEEVTTTYTSDEDPPECVKNGLRITNVRRVPFPELGMDIIDPSQESSDESQDEEDASTAHVDLVAPLQSWEENWLFQKKRVPIQSDPVAMLVPSSSTDFKALIGDKDAEDTSDLSECSSAQSDEEIEKELIEAINNVVPRSPKISECEIVEGLNENESVRKDIEDFYSTQKNFKFNETSLTFDYKNKTKQLSNGDVKRIEDTSNGKNEDIKKGTKLQMNSLNNNHLETNYKIEINDRKFETRSEYEVEKKDSKAEIQRADIRLIQSQKDTSPDVPKTPTQSTKASMLENNLEVIPNDLVDLNEKNDLLSLDDIQDQIILRDINGEEDKTMSYSLDVYSKEEVHFEDGAQQESEYTEHYDTATQRHLDSLTKDDIYLSQNDEVESGTTLNDIKLTSNLSSKEEIDKCREAVTTSFKANSASYSSSEKTAEKDIQLSTPPRPGTIAEREHKKWENAAPIENNPYSEKNIQRRLLERQYSRRSADIPGMNAELPLSNGTDLVLEPNEPDIKRFGRDYYINNARSPSGDKIRKSPAVSASSRPDSALSQRSGSTAGTDQEQQNEESLDKDMAYDSPKSRTEKWRRNNSNSSAEESTKDEYTEKKKNDASSPMKRQKSWNDEKVEDFLENERKNSKNEINARLNNQDNNCGIFETKKSYNQSDNQKMIRRIDLKAYGFENDFDSNKQEVLKPTRPQRVVNKLDLKSFGYDGGLRRTQSHDQINGLDIKPRIVRMAKKSNLIHFRDHSNFDDRDNYDRQCSDDQNLTQSTGTLNELCEQTDHNFYNTMMTSAKSVPNIANSEYYEDSNVDSKDIESVEEDFVMNGSKDNKKLEVDVGNDSGSSNVSSEIDAEEKDRSTEKLLNGNHKEDFSEEKMNLKNIKENKLPMPSVRRLAEAFNKPTVIAPTPAPRTTKSNTTLDDRCVTPELQIIETPRQMHSLTARSLSRQFREGLRQIPYKVTSPPASHVTMEQQSNDRENRESEIVQVKQDQSLKDINVIAPGKLKSNIKFWEQMQRRS